LDRLAESAWTKVAREHGITRVRRGFDISQLVHEFVVLRRVIYEVVHTQELAFGQAESLLADLLDAAISAAVEAYVGARDYEARRAQAANIGFLTHELRQPLSMAMFAAASLRRCIADEDAHVLDTLDRGLGGLADLIDSVLLTQKLEVGEVNVQPTEITMSQLMEPVESLRRTAEQKGLRFHVTYDPELRVVVDPTLTRSAIQNLAENAVKYTDSGEVEISVAHTADEVIVDVRDTCRGISAEELRTIFQPFKRGRTEKTGTGLGLAIARRAIEAQEGRIHAESPGLSGCHFSIRFPRRSPRRT
jgi:signal transduction histidine kinase